MMTAWCTFLAKRAETLLLRGPPSVCTRRSTHSQSLWEELLGRKIEPAAAKQLEDAFLEYRVRKAVPSWLPFPPNCSFWIPSSEETIKNLQVLAERIKVSKPARKDRISMYKSPPNLSSSSSSAEQGKVSAISKVAELSLIQQTDKLLSGAKWSEGAGQGSQKFLSLKGGSLALPWQQNMSRYISTLRAPVLSPFLSKDKVQPGPSPLTMVPTPTDQSQTGSPGQVDRTRPVQAVLKKIKESPKKVNLVAALVRGMRVEDALLQLAVLQKRAAHTVKRVVANARANATHNHGLNGDRLYVAQAFVGKGKYLKRISYHAKGRSGIMHHPSCRLTVIVKEMSDKQEAEIARYQTMTFRERAKHKTPLIPHKLIETSSSWYRKPKPSSDILDT